MPASTSSKTSVATWATSLVTVCIARLKRESSPPEATLESAAGIMLGCVATRSSICSSP
jgi:hypothetical protein